MKSKEPVKQTCGSCKFAQSKRTSALRCAKTARFVPVWHTCIGFMAKR